MDFTTKELSSPPPRAIRICCSIGSDLHMIGIPLVKINQITSLEKLGPHKYLGDRREGDGIIYTRMGGFIDIAHLRDCADWTAYLYSFILMAKEKDIMKQKLGHEGGDKTLYLQLPAEIDSLDEMLLAGRIAYDISIWHEIGTGYGISSVPLISERFSSFSVEDAYSNLLGVILAIQALESELPYEEAMSQLISNVLDSLGAVKTEAETYAAIEDVRNIWWTRDARLPSNKITLERQLEVYPCIMPFIIPGREDDNGSPVILNVPENTHSGMPLTDMYQLEIKLNFKFPINIRRTVTQNDFNFLITDVAEELNKSNLHKRDHIKKSASAKKRKSHNPA
jgi:hypothetical protein